MKMNALLWLCVLAPLLARADQPVLLVPDRVFDGAVMHAGWQVLVQGDRIVAVDGQVITTRNLADAVSLSCNALARTSRF